MLEAILVVVLLLLGLPALVGVVVGIFVPQSKKGSAFRKRIVTIEKAIADIHNAVQDAKDRDVKIVKILQDNDLGKIRSMRHRIYCLSRIAFMEGLSWGIWMEISFPAILILFWPILFSYWIGLWLMGVPTVVKLKVKSPHT